MRNRRGWLVGAVAAVLVLVLALAATVTVVLRQRADQARREKLSVAGQFLAAWTARRYTELDRLASGGTPSRLFQTTDERLKVTKTDVRTGTLSGDAVAFTARLDLAGLGPFTYTGSLTVRDAGQGVRVVADPSSYHPALRDGLQLDRTRTRPNRGELQDRTGRALRPLSSDLAGNVLGTVGAAPQATDRVLQGEPTGLNGLERALDAQLGGRPGGAVVVTDAAGKQVQVLQEFATTPGTNVRTTLDAGMQAAAEQALSGVPSRSALVAMDASTGELRAIANNPASGLPASFNAYPPGSTFKIVTATAGLLNGANEQTPLDCPPTITVGGRTFGNDAGMGGLGQIPLLQAFTVSCNTAFIGLSRTLPDGALQQAAQMYGFGRKDLLPFGTQGGTAPPAASPVEAAADAIGQGKVQASPLLMASVAAAVADGTWRQPRLVPGDGASTPLPAQVVEPLRHMMRSVVTSGTGRAANLPGPPVSGKTGTAEYGTATPPLTHAWFVGFRGTLAFAVFVETGSAGGAVAAPAAARFLQAVPG